MTTAYPATHLPANFTKDSLLTKWKDNQYIRNIEGQRRHLLADTRVLNSLPGVPSDYDSQTVQTAMRGSKNRANSLRLCECAYTISAQTIVELGTNLGISAAYLTTGAIAANTPCRLITADSSGCRLGIARELHDACGLRNIEYIQGYFSDTLHKLVAKAGAIDLAFIDGDHTYEGTLNYCNVITEYLKGGGVLIFDDIEWSYEMRCAWSKISILPTWAMTFTEDGVGYVIKKLSTPHNTDPHKTYKPD